ncbi:MAG: GNAT family N-acetyltransferase [Planctomycetota bacterium]|jgi:RimJ/RimL family protein N-acetyltransferase
MCTESKQSADILIRKGPYYLASFDKLMAPVVASWVADHHQLFWLAPQTYPPLTEKKVLAWHKPGANPLLFYRDGSDQPLGYGELNTMFGQKGHYWMGHCLIQPKSRGIGLGRLFIDLMLDCAFEIRKVKHVSLIAFPDNTPAVRCYNACGFVITSEQTKYFPTTGNNHRMLLMTINPQQYRKRRSQKPTPSS